MKTVFAFALLAGWVQRVCCHFVLTYPGWRGMTLITNETFPNGMQWQYPCGGIGVTTNRTYWPLTGGAVAVQPGWFHGHSSTTLFVNLGLGEAPYNHSFAMTKFHVSGPPGDNPYPGTACLPSVPLPAGVTPKKGDLATIQVIELHNHGAGAYNCVDIEFTDDESLIPPVNESTCFNSTNLVVDGVSIVPTLQSGEFCQDFGSPNGTIPGGTTPPASSVTEPNPSSSVPTAAGVSNNVAKGALVSWGLVSGVVYLAL